MDRDPYSTTTEIRPTPPNASPPPEPFLPPQQSNRWQDWAILVIAVWFFFSPWILQFGTAAPTATAGAAIAANHAASHAAWNAWVLGALVFITALSAIGRMEFWQERINFVLGAWVFAAPWALGFAHGPFPRAAWDHWIVGALVLIFAFWNLLSARSVEPPPPTLPPRRPLP